MSLARKISGLFGATQGTHLDPSVGGLPPGVVAPFAGSVAPAGWLLCYGQAVSRTTYAALFAAIGVIYGAGDGSTTFNLPDMRGRVMAGKDNMGGTAASRLTTAGAGVDGATLGTSGGSQTYTLTTAHMPAHSHVVTDAGHSHSVNDGGHAHTGSTATGGSHSHTVASVVASGSSTFSGQVQAGTWTGTVTSSTHAGHSHGVTVDGAYSGVSLNGNTTGVSVQNNGSGTAHPILQPTIVLNYIVKT